MFGKVFRVDVFLEKTCSIVLLSATFFVYHDLLYVCLATFLAIGEERRDLRGGEKAERKDLYPSLIPHMCDSRVCQVWAEGERENKGEEERVPSRWDAA